MAIYGEPMIKGVIFVKELYKFYMINSIIRRLFCTGHLTKLTVSMLQGRILRLFYSTHKPLYEILVRVPLSLRLP